MKIKCTSYFFGVFFLIFLAFPIVTSADENIVLTVEEPSSDSIYSGVSNIRGWAVSVNGIDHIELFMDGIFKTNIPSGGLRNDVGSKYSKYPGSKNSGFSIAYNYSDMSAGAHTITIRAFDKIGGAKDINVPFIVTRFDSSFIADPKAVNLRGSALNVGSDGRSILIDNMSAGGQVYKPVRLDWRTATQGFAITQIGGRGASSSDASQSSMLNLTSYGVFPAAVEDIILHVEEPFPDSTYSGVSNIRGWAISVNGIDHIELFLDSSSTKKTDIPSGGLRKDVGNAYPQHPGSEKSGFSMAYNYSDHSAGEHTITIKAFDKIGGIKEVKIPFTVTRFTNSFIENPEAVNLRGSTLSVGSDGRSILIDNPSLEGNRYDQIRLEWRTATQGFAITQIKFCTDPAACARWGVLNTLCCSSESIFVVAIDGVSKQSNVNNCQTSPTWTGYARTFSGTKNESFLYLGCGILTIGFTTARFENGKCYVIIPKKSSSTFLLDEKETNCEEPPTLK